MKSFSPQEIEAIKQQRIDNSLLLWTLEYRKIREQPFNFFGHWYLKDIYKDNHPKVYIKKSAQCGISEFMVNSAIFYTTKGYNSIYVFPNASLMSDFCGGRIDPIFNETDYLRSLLGATNNVQLKQIGKGFLYLRGAGAEEKVRRRKLKSIDADIIYYDELDEMPEDTITKGRTRLGHSNLAYERGASTPTFPGTGIDKIYNNSNQFEWFIKCNHCGYSQTLRWPENVNIETAQVICSKCKRELDRTIEGEWVAKYPENKEIHCYYVNKLFCERSNIVEIIQKSKAELEVDIQEFWNSEMGMPYEPKGQSILDSDLLKCKADYAFYDIETECTMGVDVGKNLNYRISKLVDSKRKMIKAGTVKNFEELDILMNQYDIDTCVIDANPETRKAKEFQDRFKGRVYLAYYYPSDIQRSELYILEDKDTDEDLMNFDIVKINRTQAGDYIYNSFVQRKNILPYSAWSLEGYIEQMKAPKRIPKRGRDSNIYYSWEEFGKPDHYFHADIYDYIATEIKKNSILTIDSKIGAGNDREINYYKKEKDLDNFERDTASMDF